MAKKRMFSLQIVDTDAFLDMPLSTQALYFHLSMRADDDGFVNNPKKIMKMVGSQDDDLKVLFGKRFVLDVGDGIIVIKHWRLNNYIRKDRYEETKYLDEKKQLIIKKNGAYSELGIPDDNQTDTQSSIDKVRLDKVSIDLQPEVAEEIEYIEEKNTWQSTIASDSKKLLDYFFERYFKLSGKKPVMTTWAKYNKNAQRYIKTFGLEEMKNKVEKYFKSTDKFFSDNNYPIDIFLTDNVINKLD